MIGVTIHFVYNFNTYITYKNRGNGDEVERLELYNILATNIFRDENKAIDWIMEILSEFNCADIFKDDDSDEAYDNISIEKYVELLYDHWNSEFMRDNFNYYESKIILFDPQVVSDK